MKKAKEYSMPEVKTVFTFRNMGLQALYDKYVRVQLKEGQYKEGWWGSHQKDWAYYYEYTYVLGAVTKVENLPANVLKLTGFSRMLPVHGKEMVEIIKTVEPNATIETARKYLQEISKAIRFATEPVVVPPLEVAPVLKEEFFKEIPIVPAA